jgi:AcrR family transcriptional regulator
MAGLRERKKQATREALSMAALKLAVERGIENVLVEDIAAAVNVSPRTFNNYFSSKYEAIVWRDLNRAMVIGDLLRARPAEEPLWDAVIHAVLEVYGVDVTPPPGWIDSLKQLMSTPQMLGEVLKSQAAVQDELATAIAERLGVDNTRHMYPRVAAGAVMAAYQTARDQWLDADALLPMGQLVREALRQLNNLQGGPS